MYELIITKIKYPKNDTNIYEYSSIDNLIMELKIFIEKKVINENDIIRIKKNSSF